MSRFINWNFNSTKSFKVVSIVSSIGIIGYLYNKFWINRKVFINEKSLKGKTILITGANAGLGYQAAREFLHRDGRVILACRNLIKGELAREKLLKEIRCDQSNIRLMKLDLSSLKSIREFSQIYLNEEDRLNLLICNAGLTRSAVKLTEDHFDQVIQSNYLGHFLLINLLTDKLEQSKPSRIIHVSSDLHQMVKSIDDWSDVFTQLKNRSMMGSYPQSKLFQILSTIQMKSIYFEKGINVFSLTPGWVSTSIEDPVEDSIPFYLLPIYRGFTYLMKYFFAKTVEKGAETILFCSLDPSLEYSKEIYFQNCQVCQTSSLASDRQIAQHLWDSTEQALQISNKSND